MEEDRIVDGIENLQVNDNKLPTQTVPFDQVNLSEDSILLTIISGGMVDTRHFEHPSKRLFSSKIMDKEAKAVTFIVKDVPATRQSLTTTQANPITFDLKIECLNGYRSQLTWKSLKRLGYQFYGHYDRTLFDVPLENISYKEDETNENTIYVPSKSQQTNQVIVMEDNIKVLMTLESIEMNPGFRSALTLQHPEMRQFSTKVVFDKKSVEELVEHHQWGYNERKAHRDCYLFRNVSQTRSIVFTIKDVEEQFFNDDGELDCIKLHTLQVSLPNLGMAINFYESLMKQKYTFEKSEDHLNLLPIKKLKTKLDKGVNIAIGYKSSIEFSANPPVIHYSSLSGAGHWSKKNFEIPNLDKRKYNEEEGYDKDMVAYIMKLRKMGFRETGEMFQDETNEKHMRLNSANKTRIFTLKDLVELITVKDGDFVRIPWKNVNFIFKHKFMDKITNFEESLQRCNYRKGK